MVTNLPGVVVGPRLTLDNVNARLVELEQVVAKVAKVIWYDDSMTKAMPFITNTTNTTLVEPFQSRVTALQAANEDLRNEIDEKDDEISRLTDIIGRNEEKIDELNDKLYDITHILGV